MLVVGKELRLSFGSAESLKCHHIVYNALINGYIHFLMLI